MRAPIDTVEQATNEELSWGISWSANGAIPDGDTIVSAEWSITDEAGEEDPLGAEIDEDGNDIVDGVETWTRVITPTAGVNCLLTCLATTSGGDVLEHSLLLVGV